MFVDRVEFDFTVNTRGIFHGYRMYSGGDNFQYESLQEDAPVDNAVIEVGQTVPWGPGVPPSISFEPQVSGERMPELSPYPCGNELEFNFNLALEEPTRLAGLERIGTAVAASRHAWPDGSASSVTLAASHNFPDALAGSPSAVAADGPLLLTPSDALSLQTSTEITRVLGGTGLVRILGGERAVEAMVADELRAKGHTVQRISGSNRYETAVRIAETTVTAPTRIYIADGNDFPDAMIAGAAAATGDTVSVLTSGTTLPDSTASYLNRYPEAQLVAVGSAAGDAVPWARRVAGQDQYETSVVLAREIGATAVGIASGQNFPDGLSGGAHIGKIDGPLVLSRQDRLPVSVRDYVNSDAVDAVFIYGGTVALSSDISLDATGLARFVR